MRVVAIDAKRVEGAPHRFEVFTHGGRKATGLDAVCLCSGRVRPGGREILLTSMDRDGTGEGFDLELTRAIADAVSVPVIASGGAGALQHLAEAVTDGHASAVWRRRSSISVSIRSGKPRPFSPHRGSR